MRFIESEPAITNSAHTDVTDTAASTIVGANAGPRSSDPAPRDSQTSTPIALPQCQCQQTRRLNHGNLADFDRTTESCHRGENDKSEDARKPLDRP